EHVLGLRHHAASDEISGATMPHHGSTSNAPEGSEGGQEIDRLQNVGFALPIISYQHLETGPEIGIKPSVVAKIAEAKMSEMHGEKRSRPANACTHRWRMRQFSKARSAMNNVRKTPP